MTLLKRCFVNPSASVLASKVDLDFMRKLRIMTVNKDFCDLVDLNIGREWQSHYDRIGSSNPQDIYNQYKRGNSGFDFNVLYGQDRMMSVGSIAAQLDNYSGNLGLVCLDSGGFKDICGCSIGMLNRLFETQDLHSFPLKRHNIVYLGMNPERFPEHKEILENMGVVCLDYDIWSMDPYDFGKYVLDYLETDNIHLIFNNSFKRPKMKYALDFINGLSFYNQVVSLDFCESNFLTTGVGEIDSVDFITKDVISFVINNN